MSFYMVLADNSPMTKQRHATLQAARAEALRLADLNPGVKFFVLGSRGHALLAGAALWVKHIPTGDDNSPTPHRGLIDDEVPF